MQQTLGNAWVARQLAGLNRSVFEEQINQKPPRLIPESIRNQIPPGYKKGGPVPELAKPQPCGKFYQLGNERIPQFVLGHIQSSAHWLAHEWNIRGGETCEDGFSVRVQDLIAGKKQIPFSQASFDDLWWDQGTQVGMIVGIAKTTAGATEFDVRYFNPETCKAEAKRVTGGLCYQM